MVQNKILYIICLLLSLPPVIQAQETWTVNMCIQHALENNTSLKQYQLSVKNEKLEAKQSKLNLLPSVTASSNSGTNYGRSLDQNNNYTETGVFSASGRIGASVSLFQGFSKLNKISYAKYRLQAAEWERLTNEDDIAFNILSTYYDIVFYTGMVQIAKDQLKISNYNFTKTKTQVEIGIQAKSDLLQMQANLEREKLDILLAENKVEEIKYNLWEQMNYKIDLQHTFEIDYDISSHESELLSSSDSLFYSFSAMSPELKKSEADVSAAQKNIAIARGKYLPSLSLNTSLSSSYYDSDINNTGKTTAFSNQIDNNLNKYIGASISIPIFNQNFQRTRVKQAKISQEKAQNRYEEQKRILYYRIANDIRELKALHVKHIQTEKKLQADQMAYEVAFKKYSEGLINIIELLTIKEQMADSESQLLLSKIQYQIKSKTLEFYKGNRFWQ